MSSSFHTLPIASLEPSLAEVMDTAEAQLTAFAQNTAFESHLSLAFGSIFAPDTVDQLRASLAAGRDDWPTLELRSASELQGALGAYAATTRTIYLSTEFVAANAATPENILAVFLEELGHDLEARFNPGGDAAGDEGAIFSALVRGENLSEAQLAALRAEDDRGLLLIDGETVAVEFAAFTVTNTNDSGPGSLRQAIIDANGNGQADTITFAPGLSGQTIALSSGQLTITDDLTIDGDLDDDGAPDITVTRAGGAADFRIFNVDDGDRGAVDQIVVLDGLTITGGRTTAEREDGGGIRSRENLTVSNSTVSGNSTTGDFSDGGGIDSIGGDLSLNNSTVSSNSTAGERSKGGGINSSSGLSLNNSTVSGNSTTGESSDGGGINSSSDINLNNSTVSGNSTAGERSVGGGIYSETELNLGNSTVSGNSTTGDESLGGGIFNNGGDLSISNSTVSSNSTSGDGSFGGGISSLGGDLSISNSTVSSNSTSGDGSFGGGIFSRSDLSISNSTVSSNSTTGNTGRGGGIFSFSGDVSVSNSTVSGNSTAGTNSGGGGIINATDQLTINNSIVSGNDAQQSDGAEILDGTGQGTGSNNVLGNNDNGKTNADAFVGFDTTTSITATNDGTNPTALSNIIDPLTNNGGPTQTHALLKGSPAIDAGANPNNLTTDQRGPGFTRTSGSATDIGAFERIKREQRGDDGINFLVGDAGDDALFGEGGIDTLNGGNGDDCLDGGDGNDFLYGGFGDDELLGGNGADTLSGDNNDDTILGGTGGDNLLGGLGDDLLDGGKDDDWLTGGFGIDTFVLRPGDGNDIVWDYQDGIDKFRLEGGLSFGNNSGQVEAVAVPFTLNTALRIVGTGEVLATLSLISPNAIDAGDFIAA